MPKTTFTISDFTGGVNSYQSPNSIEDTEVAEMQGFKIEPGVIEALGDMKGSYTPSAANAATEIEPGYGLFAFSHDYDANGDINATDYIILLDSTAIKYDIYSNSADDSDDDAWVADAIGHGTSSSGSSFAGSIKPCFYIGENAIRVSPGNFTKKDSGGDLNSANNDITNFRTGELELQAADSDITDPGIDIGDTVVIGGQEFIAYWRDATSLVLYIGATTAHSRTVAAGTDTDDIYVLLETRWRGIVNRKNFTPAGTIGTFTSWYSTFATPRPPVAYNATYDGDKTDPTVAPFMAQLTNGNIATDGSIEPSINLGVLYTDTNADATWDAMTVNIYCSALYDDIKQESHPLNVDTSGFTIPAATNLSLYVNVHFASSGAYTFNKRCTGARVYYEDVTVPGMLYQLLEIDFEQGCKLPESITYTPWVSLTANRCVGSHDNGHTASNRTASGGDAFIFNTPPQAFTFEMNSGYPVGVDIHARYKTATVCNGRAFIGNVYQAGEVHGDRMVGSPTHNLDIFPDMEPNVIRIATGDGDEIIKLASYGDKVLQFKKRTVYILNVAGEAGSELLESQHKNMGVENPSQVCETEFGIAWANAGGVYLYDGADILDLTTEKLKQTDSTRPKALNITESNIPIVGYHPGKKWLVVMPQSKITDANDIEAWVHDFKNKTWAYSADFTTTDEYKSNLVWTSDNELIYAAGTNLSDTPDLFKYRELASSPSADKLYLLTKAFDLGEPGTKKKLQGIYVKFSAAANTKIEADVIYTHPTGESTDDLEEADSGTTYYTEALGFKNTSGAIRTVQLVPTTPVTNAYTFQLRLRNDDEAYDYSSNFKLFSLQFIYRPLGVR